MQVQMDEMQQKTLFDDENKRRTAWDGLELLTKEAHENAVAHGFYEALDKSVKFVRDAGMNDIEDSVRRDFVLAQLAKIGSEMGEAVSALQHGQERKAIEEIADIVIRALDLGAFMTPPCEFVGEVLRKMEYNRTREYLHGKRC
jgi:phosphoribosyl-ATP pyrophosphohydrolase